ncbi:hypothetical protein WJX73_009781 [Symbiochloris irregularis]|uniref:Protein disulfide-isomerase n=1 Tax=Symbiochloris irregularis TaxID=706552 RepID=A0AAW1NY42_9CHLO
MLSYCGVSALILLSAGLVAGKDAVLTGTGSNFKDIIQKNDFVAVEFYASWCGHCKNLAPEWEKAAKVLKKNDPPVVLVKIEATEEDNKELASKYGVGGFPTIKLFKGGDLEKPSDYTGPRDADGIVAFLSARAGPASKEITSAEEVEKLKESSAAVLGVFKSSSSSELKAFKTVADAQRDSFSFAHTTEAKLAGSGVSAPGVILFKQYDDPETIYEGKVTQDALMAWLEKQAVPLVAELDQKPHNSKAVNLMFSQPSSKVVAIFQAKDDDKDAKAFRTAMQSSAKKSSDLKHLVIDSSANAQALQYFGLTEKDVPAVLVQSKEDEKFIKKNAVPKDLEKFVAQYEAGKLKPTIKSEEPPKDNSGPVKVVTANTFDEIVNSGNDVLIEFYAPWCGHCKQLVPVYEKVGKAFQKNKTVTIAKMDATANDVPKKYEVRGFPTIKFISGKDGTVLSYTGDRSEADLKAFVDRRGAPAPKEAEEDDSEDYGTGEHDEL